VKVGITHSGAQPRFVLVSYRLLIDEETTMPVTLTRNGQAWEVPNGAPSADNEVGFTHGIPSDKTPSIPETFMGYLAVDAP
jgi:hypothetical protein